MLAKLLSAVALTVLASTQSLLVELAKSRNGGGSRASAAASQPTASGVGMSLVTQLW